MSIRSLLKSAPLYAAYFVNKHAHRRSKWTANDDKMLDFYLKLVQPGDLVFDIGRTSASLRAGSVDLIGERLN